MIELILAAMISNSECQRPSTWDYVSKTCVTSEDSNTRIGRTYQQYKYSRAVPAPPPKWINPIPVPTVPENGKYLVIEDGDPFGMPGITFGPKYRSANPVKPGPGCPCWPTNSSGNKVESADKYNDARKAPKNTNGPLKPF